MRWKTQKFGRMISYSCNRSRLGHNSPNQIWIGLILCTIVSMPFEATISQNIHGNHQVNSSEIRRHGDAGLAIHGLMYLSAGVSSARPY